MRASVVDRVKLAAQVAQRQSLAFNLDCSTSPRLKAIRCRNIKFTNHPPRENEVSFAANENQVKTL
jgi:hypothetical protein